MSMTNRTILAGLALIGIIAAFWMLVLSPKREEASELGQRVEQLQAAVAEQEQIVAAAEAARDDFDANYRKLVALGKAVPEDADTASLLVQLEEVAGDSGVEFSGIRLSEGGGGDPPATGPEQTTADDGGEGESEDGEDGDGEGEETSAEPAVPTEPAVAGLPLGASVGPAGLPTMPYVINLSGDFFELADFLAEVDSLIRPKNGNPRVRGRLVTIDGFGLEADDEQGFPMLDATLSVTTFVTPPEQGLAGGASPTGPAPAVPAETTTAQTP